MSTTTLSVIEVGEKLKDGSGKVATSQRNCQSKSSRWWMNGERQGARFPESEEQARAHIEWIRKIRKVDEPDANARALNAVLKQ